MQGNVIASLPKDEVKKLEYFKLSPGQILYDINGEIIAKAPSIKEDVEKFHGGKTKDERLSSLVKIQIDSKESVPFTWEEIKPLAYPPITPVDVNFSVN